MFSMLEKQIKKYKKVKAKVVFHMNSWIKMPQTVSSRILNSFLTKEKHRFWLVGYDTRSTKNIILQIQVFSERLFFGKKIYWI